MNRTPASRGGVSGAAPGGRLRRILTPKVLNRLRLVLTLLTFGVLGWYLHTRPRLDLASLHPRWGYFLGACLCVAPALWLRAAAKWRMLLRGTAPAVTYGEAFRSYLGALALGLVTPGRVGEFSRGLYLPHRGAQGWRGAGLVLIDNWLDFLAVLFWACLGWGLCFRAPGLMIGLGLALLFAPVRFWLGVADKVTAKLPSLRGFRDSSRQALAAGEGVSRADWIGSFAAAMLAYGLDWLQLSLLLSFLLPQVPAPWHLAGMMALVTLANSFQVTLAGLGVREGLSMLLLAREGVGSEAAVAAVFLQSCLGQFLPALAGLAVKPVALYAPEDRAD